MVTSVSGQLDRGRSGLSMARLVVTRRALFARDLSVWGYELIGASGVLPGSEGASAEVGLLNALAELGTKTLVGEKASLITVGSYTLLGRLPLPSSEGTVLMLPVTLAQARAGELGPELVDAIDERLDEGFQFALTGDLSAPGIEPLRERATLIRVPYAVLAEGAVDALGPRGRGQRLWVDGVDQPEDFPKTRQYAPDFFSGDFLLKPSPVEGRRAPRDLSVLMELMTKLRKPDVSFSDIEATVRRDAGLSVTLLRFLNSAGFGLRVQVNNIRQAVALLGLNEFSKWVTLVGLGEASQKPAEVLLTALIRAKTCELVASRSGEGANGGTAFMVGLFSLLDAMLDQPLERVLEDLPVSDVMRSALLDQSGYEGEILAAVLDYERGLIPESLPRDAGDLFDAWQRAVRWAEALRSTLPEPARVSKRRG